MPLNAEVPHILCPSGRELPLDLRRDKRARRITLRLEPAEGLFTLVVPRGASLAEALNFAQHKARWMERQLAALPPRVPFEPGAVLPLLGEDHVIRHLPEARRGTWREAGEIRVSGFLDYLPRRVADFLKREAREEIGRRAQEKAARIERPIARLSVRDTRSRWGSCNSDGCLNFSWRLILTPEPVLDYVVAHEVAHLKHLHHGPRFWSLVGKLTDEMDGARRWLHVNGNSLHRYG